MGSNKLSGTALKRLQVEEINSEKAGKECGFIARPRVKANGGKEYETWDVFITGPKDTPYEGFYLHAELLFPSEYPFSPPTMTFYHKLFHPNIYENGKVCISILNVDDDPTEYIQPSEKWSPIQTIKSIIISVTSLISGPNCDSPANVDAKILYESDYRAFYKKVRDSYEPHAKLIQERYQLPDIVYRDQ